MRRICIFLLFSILFSLASFWYLQDPGQVDIVWLGYEIHLSLIVSTLALLISFFILALVISMIGWVCGMPFRFLSFLQKRQKKDSQAHVLDQLTAFEAEDFAKALQYQKQTEKILAKDPLCMWISAGTLEKTGHAYEAEKYFSDLTDVPLTAFLGLKGRIRLALERGDRVLAQTLLEEAEQIIPSSPWVLKHLLAIFYEDKRFSKARDLLKKLEELKIFPLLHAKKQRAHLCYAEAIQPNLSLERKLALLKESHSLDPSLPEAAECLAGVLMETGQGRNALRVLEATWKVNPSQALGDFYLALSAPKNNLDAYQIATRLLKKAPHLPESLLFLARTALNAKLWGESRAQLLLLQMQHPTSEVYGLLATLELEENQDLKAAIGWLEKGIKIPRETLLLSNNIGN